MENLEDEDYQFEHMPSKKNQFNKTTSFSENWAINRLAIQNLKIGEDEIDSTNLLNKKQVTYNDCQLKVCNCDCCCSNIVHLSSSIVHIDENDNSDDEYILLEENNCSTNNDVENKKNILKNLINSKKSSLIHSQLNSSVINSQNLSHSTSSFNQNKITNNLCSQHQPYNQTETEYFSKEVNQSLNMDEKNFSSVYTKPYYFLTKTTTALSTTTTSSESNRNQTSYSNPKCHCQLSSYSKHRPLSLSSISSSSSSCCSLSRNNSLALSDLLKKPYLASIESLGDDELNNSNNKYRTSDIDQEDQSSSGVSSNPHCDLTSTEPSVQSTCSCCVLKSNSNISLVRSASTNSNRSHCKCFSLESYSQESDFCSENKCEDQIQLTYQNSSLNSQSKYDKNNSNSLSQIDRVMMEIVETESTYVKDLKEIIEGYYVYLTKQILETLESHQHKSLIKKVNSNQQTINRDNYNSDCDEECNNTSIFAIPSTGQSLFEVSSTILKASINKPNKRSNKQQRAKSSTYKPTFGDLNLDELNNTSQTLPRSNKQIVSSKSKNSQLLDLNKKTNSEKLNQEQLNNLFGNLNDIYKFNSMFLTQLIQCDFDPMQIAQCFVDNADGFHIYSQYCTNYPKQVETLTELNRNNSTNQLLKTRQVELGHSLPLGSYLLKPVQRILKYHLLLNNMVKNFELENSELQSQQAEQCLRNALLVMTNIATHINTMKKKHEHAVRVQEIQSLLTGWQGQDLTTFGELVAEGSFKVFGNKTSRHLFLFDKMLLVVKKKDDSMFTYKGHILCSNLMLIESIRSEPLCFHAIPFNNPKIQYTFQAKNLEQKREWCLLLKNVILESYQAIPSHAKQIILGLGQMNNLITEQKHKVFPVHLNRKLSAPEYLEKRCKAQQKTSITSNNVSCKSSSNNLNNLSLGLQFSSLQKGFKLRKSLKKSVSSISNRNSTVSLISTTQNDNIIFSESNNLKNLNLNSISSKKKLNDSIKGINCVGNDLEMNYSNHSKEELLLENDTDKMSMVNNISSCLSSTSLTTTNDSGVGSTSSVCCYSQLRLTTPISLGSSFASIESNVTTTTANSYGTNYSQVIGSSNSSTRTSNLKCSESFKNFKCNQNDDFHESLNDSEGNAKIAHCLKHQNKHCCNYYKTYHQSFSNKGLKKKYCNGYDCSLACLSKFDSNCKKNYLHNNTKLYQNHYLHNHVENHCLNLEETDYRPSNQIHVRRVQSFTIGNKNVNLNGRIHANHCCNKNLASNGEVNMNNTAFLQHTVSFRKSPNVDLVLAKLRHLHRRPAIVAAQKQLYKQQQQIQQLNEVKTKEFNEKNIFKNENILKLNNSNLIEKNDSEESLSLKEKTLKTNQKNDEKVNSIYSIYKLFENDSSISSDDDEDNKNKLFSSKNQELKRPNKKFNKNKDSNSMEELSPTLPAIWLKNQKAHFIPSLKKGGSLPKNFEACL